ncbi:MAG TPA: sigma-70 family RNA polymerase sigma factor [Gemmataceae bacterium]|nr:sigma-70 family RNA polymerase sigma factor [Gemmataceae bacterium]
MGIRSHLRRVAVSQRASDLTDGELVEAFTAGRDGVCFEALVRRHGPMVLGVCQRVLRDPHDADDAFQAVFLVLVRRAAAVPRAAVGSWLYGVAYRTALDARRAAARRRARERSEQAMPHPTTGPGENWAEVRPVLDAELSRLADKYRSAIVLCDIEGLTRAEAARQLGLPEGTVSGRLTTARRLLAGRLARRGVTLSAAALGAVLGHRAIAAVPARLVSVTAQAGEAVATGATVGSVGPQVMGLADGVARGLRFAQWKPVLLTFAIVASSAAGVAIVAGRERGPINPPDPPAMASQRPEATARERLQGGWRVVKAELNGESILDPGFRDTGFVFVGDEFIYRTGDREQPGKYRLDPAASPATLTLATRQGVIMDCIVELTDRQLKLCWRKLGPRPVTFDTTREPEAVLFVLERQ